VKGDPLPPEGQTVIGDGKPKSVDPSQRVKVRSDLTEEEKKEEKK
jgi:hypothetical protein